MLDLGFGFLVKNCVYSRVETIGSGKVGWGGEGKPYCGAILAQGALLSAPCWWLSWIRTRLLSVLFAFVLSLIAVVGDSLPTDLCTCHDGVVTTYRGHLLGTAEHELSAREQERC